MFANMFVVAVHYINMLHIVTISTVSMYTLLSTTKYQSIPHLLQLLVAAM